MGYWVNDEYNDNYVNNNYNNNNRPRNNSRNNNGRNGGNKYRNNNNYYNNRNNNYNNNRPSKQNDNLFFDATKYKIGDIKIKDLRGRVYVLSGNLAEMYSVEMAGYAQRIMDAQAALEKDSSLENNVEIFKILKEWTLGLLKFNTQGIEVTMDDVTYGFDGASMFALLAAISEYVGKTSERVKALSNDN